MMESLNVQPIGSLSSSSSSTSSCSSGNNSSSSLVSSSVASNHSYKNSNSNPKLLNSKVQLSEVAYDFGTIMNDLKIACSTLTLIARQIDQVVSKIDDKFGFIFENLSPNNSANPTGNSNIEIVSNQMKDSAPCHTNNTNTNNGSSNNSNTNNNEFINCFKRTSNNLNNLNNRNFTKIINKSDTNSTAASCNSTGSKNKSQKNTYDCSAYSNASGVGTNGSDVLSLIENRFRDMPNVNNIHLNVNCNQSNQKCATTSICGQTSSSSSISSSSSSNLNSQTQNNLNDHLNEMKNNKSKTLSTTTKRLVNNEYVLANLINNDTLNNETSRQVPNRALSERKASVNALLTNFVGLQMGGQNRVKLI